MNRFSKQGTESYQLEKSRMNQQKQVQNQPDICFNCHEEIDGEPEILGNQTYCSRDCIEKIKEKVFRDE